MQITREILYIYSCSYNFLCKYMFLSIILFLLLEKMPYSSAFFLYHFLLCESAGDEFFHLFYYWKITLFVFIFWRYFCWVLSSRLTVFFSSFKYLNLLLHCFHICNISSEKSAIIIFVSLYWLYLPLKFLAII